jgi:hypothetical protein
MRVHVLADNFVRHAAVSTMLAKHCALTSELLDRASIRERDIDAIVVAADLSIMDNISTLKAVSAKLTHVAKRIFLIDAGAGCPSCRLTRWVRPTCLPIRSAVNI